MLLTGITGQESRGLKTQKCHASVSNLPRFKVEILLASIIVCADGQNTSHLAETNMDFLLPFIGSGNNYSMLRSRSAYSFHLDLRRLATYHVLVLGMALGSNRIYS